MNVNDEKINTDAKTIYGKEEREREFFPSRIGFLSLGMIEICRWTIPRCGGLFCPSKDV